MRETLEDSRIGEQTEERPACDGQHLRDEIKDAASRVERSFHASKAAISNTLEEGKTSAERLVNRGVEAAEACLDDVTYQVRRNPRVAVAFAFGAGAIAGTLFGLLAPRGGKSTLAAK